jgi:hypothetical protein
LPGHLRIRIESTNANDFGVNIVITDHLDVDTLKPGKENELVQILNKQWQSAANNAEKCLNEIWNKYES